MIRACKQCIYQHQALCRLFMKALAAGIAMILFLHFVLPHAEHPKILSTIGLLLDIFGVTWIAYDLFPFQGNREFTEDEVSGIETPEYTNFKRSHAAVGLTAIVIGFLFQIISYWIADITALFGAPHA